MSFPSSVGSSGSASPSLASLARELYKEDGGKKDAPVAAVSAALEAIGGLAPQPPISGPVIQRVLGKRKTTFFLSQSHSQEDTTSTGESAGSSSKVLAATKTTTTTMFFACVSTATGTAQPLSTPFASVPRFILDALTQSALSAFKPVEISPPRLSSFRSLTPPPRLSAGSARAGGDISRGKALMPVGLPIPGKAMLETSDIGKVLAEGGTVTATIEEEFDDVEKTATMIKTSVTLAEKGDLSGTEKLFETFMKMMATQRSSASRLMTSAVSGPVEISSIAAPGDVFASHMLPPPPVAHAGADRPVVETTFPLPPPLLVPPKETPPSTEMSPEELNKIVNDICMRAPFPREETEPQQQKMWHGRLQFGFKSL